MYLMFCVMMCGDERGIPTGRRKEGVSEYTGFPPETNVPTHIKLPTQISVLFNLAEVGALALSRGVVSVSRCGLEGASIHVACRSVNICGIGKFYH